MARARDSGTVRSNRSARVSEAGFTLVELTVTLVIVGVLAVVALPRFTGRSDYDQLAAADRMIAAVRFARSVAIAQNRTVYVIASASQLRACFDNACSAAVLDPANGSALTIDLTGTSITLTSSSASFSFDGLGRSSAAVTMSLSGSPVRSFTVERETGYVHS